MTKYRCKPSPSRRSHRTTSKRDPGRNRTDGQDVGKQEEEERGQRGEKGREGERQERGQRRREEKGEGERGEGEGRRQEAETGAVGVRPSGERLRIARGVGGGREVEDDIRGRANRTGSRGRRINHLRRPQRQRVERSAPCWHTGPRCRGRGTCETRHAETPCPSPSRLWTKWRGRGH